MSSEALVAVDTESGSESGGQISEGEGDYWSGQVGKASRARGTTTQGRK